jgi:hypothetical protein
MSAFSGYLCSLRFTMVRLGVGGDENPVTIKANGYGQDIPGVMDSQGEAGTQSQDRPAHFPIASHAQDAILNLVYISATRMRGLS